jgi:extradiol dioxygenase family protein
MEGWICSLKGQTSVTIRSCYSTFDPVIRHVLSFFHTPCMAHRRFRLLLGGQRGDLFLEQLLGLLPDTHVLPVLQTEQTGQQVGAESLGCLAGQQAGQVVDADDAERQVVATLGERHRHGRLAEGGVDVVNGDRVVGIGGVAGDVADDAQAARLGGERLGVDEGRDLGGEVDAVDEDVGLDDLLVWAGLGRGFGEVPLLQELLVR